MNNRHPSIFLKYCFSFLKTYQMIIKENTQKHKRRFDIQLPVSVLLIKGVQYLNVKVSFWFLETYVVISKIVPMKTGEVDLFSSIFIPCVHWIPTAISLARHITKILMFDSRSCHTCCIPSCLHD